MEQNEQLKYTLYSCLGFFFLFEAIEPLVKIVAANLAKPGIIPVDWVLQVILMLALGLGLINARRIEKRK